MNKTTLLVSVFVCQIAASPAFAQLTPLPERLCVNDPTHGPLKVNTVTRTSATSVRQKKGVLTFNALAEDMDSEIQSVVWDFGDGATGEGSTVHKTWRRKGSYVVTCRVKDDEGAEASSSVTVMVLKKKAR